MNRADVIVGPAKYVLSYASSSATFYSQDDCTIEIVTDLAQTRVNGMVEDSFYSDALVRLTCKPEGRWNVNMIAALWPWLSSTPGTSIWGATDKTLVAHDSNSHLHTIISAAVTRMPDLHFGIEDSLIGPVEITGVRATGESNWATDSKLYTAAASGGTFADSTFTAPPLQEYTAIWTGIAGFSTAFHSVGGFRARFATEINFHQLPGLGTFQGTLTNVGVAVECEPVEATAAQALTALSIQGAAARRGKSLNSMSVSLQITGAGDSINYLTIPKAMLHTGSYRFGVGSNFLRNGQFAFVATRSRTAGVLQPICTLAAA